MTELSKFSLKDAKIFRYEEYLEWLRMPGEGLMAVIKYDLKYHAADVHVRLFSDSRDNVLNGVQEVDITFSTPNSPNFVELARLLVSGEALVLSGKRSDNAKLIILGVDISSTNIPQPLESLTGRKPKADPLTSPKVIYSLRCRTNHFGIFSGKHKELKKQIKDLL